VEFSINVHEKPLHEISPVAQFAGKMEYWNDGKSWNNGMMEWWNNDTNKTNPNFLCQYSNIPVFQHSDSQHIFHSSNIPLLILFQSFLESH